MKGKTISKVGMIIGAIIIISYNYVFLIFTKTIPSPEQQKSIFMFGGGVMIIFSPIYLSIIIDKIIGGIKKDKE